MASKGNIMDYINIKISLDDYKVIRNALMNRTAKEVYSLMVKLDYQVTEQTKTEMAKAVKKE